MAFLWLLWKVIELTSFSLFIQQISNWYAYLTSSNLFFFLGGGGGGWIEAKFWAFYNFLVFILIVDVGKLFYLLGPVEPLKSHWLRPLELLLCGLLNRFIICLKEEFIISKEFTLSGLHCAEVYWLLGVLRSYPIPYPPLPFWAGLAWW